MTKVRIKSKGQFYGQIGEIAKILNQHQVAVQFPNVQGVFQFSHRQLQIVGKDDSKELELIERLRAEIEAKINDSKQYQSDFAKGYISAFDYVLQMLNVEEVKL
jgi:hypothetical protein